MLRIEPHGTNVILPAFVVGFEVEFNVFACAVQDGLGVVYKGLWISADPRILAYYLWGASFGHLNGDVGLKKEVDGEAGGVGEEAEGDGEGVVEVAVAGDEALGAGGCLGLRSTGRVALSPAAAALAKVLHLF